MTYPPLLWAFELTGFPGAPFEDALVEAAGERVRDECGWHIAPVVSETVTVDIRESGRAVLPTLRLVNVTAVRDVSGSSPVTLPLSAWRWRRSGILECGTWSRGRRTLEVDISHGYDRCPPALLDSVAQRLRSGSGAVLREQVGDVSVSYSGGVSSAAGAASKYVLAGIA